ncbi:MAG: hypothetical protein FWG62_02580 [Proteobacteria bacterium]|nr:hypothetical protein [Pseudomonadota bacterium]
MRRARGKDMGWARTIRKNSRSIFLECFHREVFGGMGADRFAGENVFLMWGQGAAGAGKEIKKGQPR